MRLMRFAVKFGVKLACNKEGVIGQFDDFDELAVGGKAAENEAVFLKTFAIRVVEFVAMAVTLFDDKRAIEASGFGAENEMARLGSQTHGAALFVDLCLVVSECDEPMR